MRIPIYKISLVREASVTAPSRYIESPTDACDILRAFIGDTDREHFVVLLLDTRHRAIGLNTVSIGHLNASVVHPREVFKPAILSSAAAFSSVTTTHPAIPIPRRKISPSRTACSRPGRCWACPYSIT